MTVIPKIEDGGHHKRPGACTMEWVDLIFSRRVEVRSFEDLKFIIPRRPGDGLLSKTDTPPCTATHIADMTMGINDNLTDSQRWRLADLIPRLLRAKPLPEAEGVGGNPLLTDFWSKVWDTVEERFPEIMEPRQWKWRAHQDGAVPRTARSFWEGNAVEGVTAYLNDIADETESLDTPFDRDDVGALLTSILSDALDIWDKMLVEAGEAIWDPDGDYPSDEEVEEIVNVLKGSK